MIFVTIWHVVFYTRVCIGSSLKNEGVYLFYIDNSIATKCNITRLSHNLLFVETLTLAIQIRIKKYLH